MFFNFRQNLASRGSEWRHLDNAKHLIFWLCNMKQLNFRHFNTNRKKFTVTVNFSLKEKKRLQKGQYYLVWYTNEISAIFGRFPIIPKDFRSLPEISEDVRGEIRKSSTIFRRYIHLCKIYFLQCKDASLSGREIVVIHSNLYIITGYYYLGVPAAPKL